MVGQLRRAICYYCGYYADFYNHYKSPDEVDGLHQFPFDDDRTRLSAADTVFYRSRKCPVAECLGSIIRSGNIHCDAAYCERSIYDTARQKISFLI